MTAHECRTFDPNCWRCDLSRDEVTCHCGAPSATNDAGQNRGMCRPCDDNRCDAYPGTCPLEPSVLPSSAVQGSVRTEGPDGLERAIRDLAAAGGLSMAQASAAVRAAIQEFNLEPPPVASRLRSLATAELEAAKGGSRIQKAAAKAAARAYRLAADMIKEEA